MEPGRHQDKVETIDAGFSDRAARASKLLVELLDRPVPEDAVQQYAHATHLAVQFFDLDGRPLSECLNPQSLWQVLSPTRRSPSGCNFSLVAGQPCDCLSQAIDGRRTVFVSDETGYAHFAVPLAADHQILGAAVAGQVFVRAPEAISLKRAAETAGLSADEVWALAQQASRVDEATLAAYPRLLISLLNALLSSHSFAEMGAHERERSFLTQRLQTMGLIAAGVAHDLNNLLAGVVGNAYLLAKDWAPGGAPRKRLDEISNAAEQAASLTKQLLAFCGKGGFAITVVDLSALVRNVIELARVSIGKGIDLRVEFAEGLPGIRTDASQIRQVVMNLILNGAESIGKENEGSLMVRTGVQNFELPLRHHPAAPDAGPGRYVFLEVLDTGPGMDASTYARMFDPFFTTKPTGYGLGMSTVLGIAQRHAGTIDIRTQPGKGTSTMVFFPIADEG